MSVCVCVWSIGRMMLPGESQNNWSTLSQWRAVHHKPQMDWPGMEPDLPMWRAPRKTTWTMERPKTCVVSLSGSGYTQVANFFNEKISKFVKAESFLGCWKAIRFWRNIVALCQSYNSRKISSHLKEPVLFEQSSYLGDFRESGRISGPNEALDLRTPAHLERKSHYRRLVHGVEDY